MLPELDLGKGVFPLIWEFLVYPDLWTGAYTFIQENTRILPQIKEGPYGSELRTFTVSGLFPAIWSMSEFWDANWSDFLWCELYGDPNTGKCVLNIF